MAAELVVINRDEPDGEARREALDRAERDRMMADLYDYDPPCTCTRTDVDLYDASGCEAHDPRSDYNEALRAVTAAEKYEQYTAPVERFTVLTDDDCPF